MNDICKEYYYNNNDIIGKGSFSMVYKGFNSKTNEKVDIKKLYQIKMINIFLMKYIF
jgi:serine/threonine protein kinase